MKNFKLKRLLSLAFIGCLSTLSASTVFAAAGDDIDNIARLEFKVGGVSTFIRSSPTGSTDDTGAVTSFKEDRLLNFTVTTTDVASVAVAPNATAQITTFRVTNTGNGTQDFSLSTLNALTGVDDPFVAGGDTDSFNVAVTNVFVNSVADVADGYLAGTDTAIFIEELASGSFIDVYVLSTIPAALADNSLSVVSLIAQVAVGGAAGQGVDIVADDSGTADDPLAVDTVFGDIAGSAVGDAVTDGKHSADSAYIINAAILSVAKTSTALWDPVNGNVNPKMITGAYVQYTLVIANDSAAGASGYLTGMTDTLATAVAGLGGLGLDVDMIDGTGVPPLLGGFTNGAAGRSFTVTHGAIVPVVNTRAAINFCTSVDDGPDDGCLVAGKLITITFTTLMPVEGTYLEGELKPGETITIVFNAIIE